LRICGKTGLLEVDMEPVITLPSWQHRSNWGLLPYAYPYPLIMWD